MFGGVVAPVLLLIGLERVSGIAGSLLLNLEAVLTMALALVVFGEHLDRRAVAGCGAIVAASAVLGMGSGSSRIDFVGMLCVAGACACWAIDNNLTQRLSGRDPFAIVRVKTAVAGAVNLTGVYLLVTERHNHRHLHEPLVHQHRHRHGDGRHDHFHDAPVMEHSHQHVHQAMSHEHIHVSDAQHHHAHGERHED